jgi:hypothetical protein
MEKVNLKKGQHLAPHTRVEIVRALIAALIESTGALASELLYKDNGVGYMRQVLQVRMRPIRAALVAAGDWLVECETCDKKLKHGELVVPYSDDCYDCVGCADNGNGYGVFYYNAKGNDYHVKSFTSCVRDRENSEALATPYTGGPGTL